MTYANLRPTAYAIFFLIGASSAAALTLERSRGSVVLGRPLDFNVQAAVNANEDAASLCLEADVFQAETLINPTRVNVQLLKPGSNGSSTVRVTSSIIVEEPVLTVVIRYGCLSKNSRQYVVFADPPVSVNEAAPASNGAPTFGPSRSTQMAQVPAASRTVADTPRAIAPASIKQSTSIVPNALVQSRRLALSAPVKNTKPRLQLDSIELNSEPSARLKSTLELLSLPAELSSVQRVEAAALWRVISAQSEDLRQDIQRLTALQAEAVALRETSTKSRAEISRLAVQLKEAENSRYQNPLVYGLLAMLALLLAGLAFMRFASKNDSTKSAWWKPRRDKNEPDDARNSAELEKSSFPKVVVQQREPVVPLKVKQVSRVADRKEPEAVPTQPRFKSSESAYAMLGAQSNARGVNVEELFDIQQQADFFISLGQHDQAIEVLQNHINENAQTSPLVYLDLLKLYHLQDKRTEYQDLTVEFTRLFNAEVPAFNAFRDQTRGIEAYQATLSQIASCWHTDTVLKVIEDSVFRKAGRTSEALDLEAYRELLLLHSIAKDLSENQGLKADSNDQNTWPKIDSPVSVGAGVVPSALPLGNFNQTIPQKLMPVINVPGGQTANNEIRSSTFQKPVGARIGLDIDLTANTPDPVLDKLTSVSDELKKEEAPQTSNSGLIEFDLDSFVINSNTKAPRK